MSARWYCNMTQPLTPEELTQLFQIIEGEPTGKLSELAKVAGLNLAEDYIGADLSGEDLSEDNLNHANLSDANLSCANLSKSNLSSAILSNANLSNANLSSADLSNANLSGANLFHANLDNTNLSNANLSNANLTAASLLQAKNLITANLGKAILTQANLELSQKEMLGLKRRGAIIEDVTLLVKQRTLRINSGNYNVPIEGNYVQGNYESYESVDYDIVTTSIRELIQYWDKRLATECSEQSDAARVAIVNWLVESNRQQLETSDSKQLEIAKQAMEYRYQILRQRYLGISKERAYRNLINRLGSLATLRSKIQTWVALSQDRHWTVIDVLQEVIQELLQNDKYMLQQMSWISTCTTDSRLKNALLLASVEEYCLRPIRNQPQLVYRFVNHLRRTQRGGITQVPSSDLIKLVSQETQETSGEDSDNQINLADTQAVAEYQLAQELEEQLALRTAVKQEFENYLQENLGSEAVQWLRLYLQGSSQDAIAKKLNKPIKEVYRLREKVSYHAVRIFALKNQPELVDNWLSISLPEHNLGLTPTQLSQLQEKLTPKQRAILELRKAGNTIEAVAEKLKLKTHQAMGEWTKVYLAAQALRTQG
jgi:hypothetical protein